MYYIFKVEVIRNHFYDFLWLQLQISIQFSFVFSTIPSRNLYF